MSNFVNDMRKTGVWLFLMLFGYLASAQILKSDLNRRVDVGMEMMLAGSYDSAELHLQKSLEIAKNENFSNNPFTISNIETSLGQLKASQTDWASAIKHANSAIAALKKPISAARTGILLDGKFEIPA